jgi:hypothetical protein
MRPCSETFTQPCADALALAVGGAAPGPYVVRVGNATHAIAAGPNTQPTFFDDGTMYNVPYHFTTPQLYEVSGQYSFLPGQNGDGPVTVHTDVRILDPIGNEIVPSAPWILPYSGEGLRFQLRPTTELGEALLESAKTVEQLEVRGLSSDPEYALGSAIDTFSRESNVQTAWSEEPGAPAGAPPPPPALEALGTDGAAPVE